MSQKIKEHYTQLFLEHGDGPTAVQFTDRDSQFKRFEVLAGLVPEPSQLTSVLDVCCGLGHLLTYLRSQGFEGTYCGVDFVPEMVEHCRQKFEGDERVSFQVSNVARDELPQGFDYAILSGAFNNVMEDNPGFLKNTVRKMYGAANKGVAFNAMSTYVDFQADNLYYSDPCEVFDFCKRELSRKVVLKHDYVVKANSIPFEYTLYVYR